MANWGNGKGKEAEIRGGGKKLLQTFISSYLSVNVILVSDKALMENESFHEIFKEPSSQTLSSDSTDNLPDVVTIKDVRITPGHMHFENAYEGKSYEEKLVIQNCGKYSALVKLLKPNSSTFEFNEFPKGIRLSPGMKIKRRVKFTYWTAINTLEGFTTILVNDSEVKYHFLVTLSQAILQIEPQILDFGKIDAVNHATTRTFYIKNLGTKGSQFAIDLGRNPLKLFVQPMKGVLPARSSVAVSVEIVGTQEGYFIEEFWVKMEPVQRVVVNGEFIAPKLLVRRFIAGLDFTLITFPPTYYGSTSKQTLLVKNFSSSHSMFCVMADIKGTTVTLDEARKIDNNYRNFIVTPTDGRIAALKGALIQITFAPVKTPVKEKCYAACFLKVIRMDCQDINDDKIYDTPRTENIDVDNSSAHSSSKDPYIGTEYVESLTSLSFESDHENEKICFEHSIGVCLDGDKARAEVSLRPSIFHLSELTVDQYHQRELLIINESKILPVRVKYNKVAAIDVKPSEFDLKPSGSLEVLVIMRIWKLGQAVRKLTFDLLAKDDGNKIRKVGMATFRIHFNTASVAKKTRLDQCVLCNDLSVKLASDFPHRMTETELANKMQNDDYYLNYIRSFQKQKPKNDNLEDYALMKSENLKCRYLVTKLKKILDDRITHFRPLEPRLLFNVKITPKSIKMKTVERVAAFTTIFDFFEIDNQNTFPIHIFARASKPCIVFENASRFAIQAKEKKKMYFSFCAESVGRYYVDISVLVNDSTLYTVTVVAYAVPKTLNVDPKTIVFEENDDNYKFIKLINDLNAFTSFKWEVPKGCFTIYPIEGGVKPEGSILCTVVYTADLAKPKVSECILTSESGQKQILTVRHRKRQHLVVFDPYNIDVGLVSLNMPIRRKVTMRNLLNNEVMYSIVEDTPIPGVTVTPKEGFLGALDTQVFIVEIKPKAVIEFSTDIVFRINDKQEIRINLTGSVEFPKFEMKPKILYFRKIAPNGYDVLAFKVENLSRCELIVDFSIGEMPEFAITESEDEQYPQLEEVVLRAKQSKVLFLHFCPQYVSTYSTNLRYVLNNILGPTLLTSLDTSTTEYFLRKHTDAYQEFPNIIVKAIPTTLSSVRIVCSAIDKVLEFSNLSLDFIYYGENHYNNTTKIDFEIFNTSSETVAVCIRTDDLQQPFNLTPKSETFFECYPVSYKIVLEPREKMTFEAEFTPENRGEYVVKLPIFLEDYYDNKIFNFLTMKGVYGAPTMTPLQKTCNLEPVPLRVRNKGNVTLRMRNHFKNCEIRSDTNLNFISTDFSNCKGRRGDYLLNVSVYCESLRTKCFESELIISCSCEARCTVHLTGVIENCLLTTHVYSHFLDVDPSAEDVASKSLAFSEGRSWHSISRPTHVFLSNSNITCFPLFPDESDYSEYGRYMRKIQQTLENWLFSQGFYKRSYYRIPEGFSNFCKIGTVREHKLFGGLRKAPAVIPPLVQLVINLGGNNLRDQLTGSTPDLEDDETIWLSYIYKSNSKILYYLRGFSVFLPHVRSKYLLTYDQYLFCEKIKHPDDEPIEESIFNRLSKQSRVVQVEETSSSCETITPKHRQSTDSRVSSDVLYENPLDIGIYGVHEKVLLAWLQSCYNLEKATLWNSPGPEKNITLLDRDLGDSIILGAVTAHYCPYVRSQIKEIDTEPFNPEDLLHNAAVLINTWKMLNFSYITSPRTFLNSGMMEMLLLVTYLYNVLPNHTPSGKLEIEVSLTQTGTASIDLENLGKVPIYYKTIFFGNENGFFSVSNKGEIHIEPKSHKTITVHYSAKTIETTTVTLLFSGETPGHKFSKSIVVTIEGIPDVSYACVERSVTVDMYRPCEITMHLESPFKVKADYQRYIGFQPVSKERNLLMKWEDVKNLKVIHEVVLEDDTASFNKEGVCTITDVFCCLRLEPKEIWFYYTNPDVGDWAVKTTVRGRPIDNCYQRLEVTLPENYPHLTCRCQKRNISVTANCPMLIHVKVPMKNVPLWDARKIILLHNVSGDELRFWQKRIFTSSGTRILKLVLDSETHPMRNVINDTVTYDVVLDKARPFVTLDKVTIDDVISDEPFDFPIHPLKKVNLLKLKQCEMLLVSEDKTETRFYKLYFISATSPKKVVQ